MATLDFDFETIADAADVDLGNPFDPGRTVMAGAQLHFKTAPCVSDALVRLSAAGLYGWTSSTLPGYLASIQNWMQEVRGWDIQRDWIVPSYGTLQAMSAAIRAFTGPEDGVIIQPPVYVLYDRVIRNTGRTKLCSPLRYENGRYAMDFDSLEAVMARPEARLMLLCNPHNPTMDCWERSDLERVAALAKRHGVLVVCDEIFAEHVYEGGPLTPYASLPEARDNCIVTTSIGKSFNFTGTSHANVIIPDPTLRRAYIRQRDADHYGSLSPFMYTAVRAAYTPDGKAWIDAMLAYVQDNFRLFHDFCAHCLPGAVICRHRAGTLVWVDLRPLGLDEDGIAALFARANIEVDLGSQYGAEGTGFVRLQLGMPRHELQGALDRLRTAVREAGLATH